METAKKKDHIGITGLPFAIMLGVPVMIYVAYVLTYLWQWFIVPIFFVPQLTVPQAFGLTLFVGLFNYSRARSSEVLRISNPEYGPWVRYCSALMTGLCHASLALGTGWVVKEYFL